MPGNQQTKPYFKRGPDFELYDGEELIGPVTVTGLDAAIFAATHGPSLLPIAVEGLDDDSVAWLQAWAIDLMVRDIVIQDHVNDRRVLLRGCFQPHSDGTPHLELQMKGIETLAD